MTVPAQIAYTFGIATREVTIKQFKRFLSEGKISTEPLDRFLQGRRFLSLAAANERCPIERVSFYAAAHYCLWLSEREKIPRDQWCYEPVDGSPLGPVRVAPRYLERSGYRIPTYDEWMYALMGQTGTRRDLVPTDETLELFDWLAENSGGRVRPVGTQKPNRLGLHDMLGNLSEWCAPREPWEPEQQPLIIGGHYEVSAAKVKDWQVCSINPEFPPNGITLRVARTLRGPAATFQGSSAPR